ncbi:MAG: hypothetical protein JWN94_4754 [Betaproteobacteria bacterium]|nr:hypothetical protein [Betaproteobacteria bacterium]
MNRKSFLILLAMLLVIGGAGLGLFWQDLSAWRDAGSTIGSKPMAKLATAEVAQVRLYDGKNESTLVLKDGRWTVKQRADYNASVQEIGDLLVKLPDLKVVQTEDVGASLLPRLSLVVPGKDVKEGAGTQLELSNQSGAPLGSLLLGKIVVKKEPSPLPIQQETPVGRYVLSAGSPTVLVTSDALKNASAKPEAWLEKQFFKADRIKSLANSGDGAAWKIARKEEFDPWKFADGAGELDPSKAVAAVNALNDLKFTDIATDIKPDNLDKPRTLVADTYDGLIYTIRFAHKPDSEDYYLTVTVTGEPPRERTPEKNEKPADKERLDKQFAESLKKLDDRVKFEKGLAGWVYLVPAKSLDPLLKARSDLVAAPRKK